MTCPHRHKHTEDQTGPERKISITEHSKNREQREGIESCQEKNEQVHIKESPAVTTDFSIQT